MKALLNRTRRRVLLSPPEQPETLESCLTAFSAGFQRGVSDVSKSVPDSEWQPLAETTSLKIVAHHSALEAGSWLAGIHRGRHDMERHVVPLQEFHLQQHLRRCFCEEWEASIIADLTLECEPSAVPSDQLIKSLFLTGTRKKIADKLPAISKRYKRQTV
ncbi:MAG: hypothetical protein ACR2QG_11175 [Gammaproteobacteria bacterium]